MKSSDKPLRFGVIGCGFMSQIVHCPNMQHVPGATTVAYCDLDESKAKKNLDTHGGEYTTRDSEKIFSDKSLDAVLIQIGPQFHPKLVQAAARAGKHVFVEKPLASTLKDALETVRVVEEAGVKCLVGFCNRMAPMIQKAKKLAPKPHYSFIHSGSTVTHMVCHNVDLVVNLFHEAPLEEIYARGGNFFGGDPIRKSADSFTAILTFADGSTSTYLHHVLENAELMKYSLQLFQADRCVYVARRFMDCHLIEKNVTKQSWIYKGDVHYRGIHGYMGHHEEQLELVAAIRENRTPLMNVRDAARAVAIEEAILQSIETKKPVHFPSFLEQHGAGFLLKR